MSRPFAIGQPERLDPEDGEREREERERRAPGRDEREEPLPGAQSPTASRAPAEPRRGRRARASDPPLQAVDPRAETRDRGRPRASAEYSPANERRRRRAVRLTRTPPRRAAGGALAEAERARAGRGAACRPRARRARGRARARRRRRRAARRSRRARPRGTPRYASAMWPGMPFSAFRSSATNWVTYLRLQCSSERTGKWRISIGYQPRSGDEPGAERLVVPAADAHVRHARDART